MYRQLVISILIGLLTAGCGGASRPETAVETQPAPDLEETAVNAEEVKPTPGHADWHDLCDQPARLTEMLSLSDAELGQRLGQPGARERFRMVERQDEFHVALQNYYPLTDEVNADVEIEEWTYAKGDARLTIWLHRPHEKWVMLEHLCWSADMEF